MIAKLSDNQTDTLTKGDSSESPLVRFDRIQRHFVEFRLTKFPSGSLTLLTKPNAAGECAVYLRVLMQDSIDYVR